MTNLENIHITSIGQIANQVLQRNPSGLITGTSSRGIFLQPEADLTLFLTNDPFRGPLTINTRVEDGSFPNIEPGELVFLSERELIFSDANQSVQIHHPLIWKPSPAATFKRQTADWFFGIRNQVRRLVPDHPFLSLLEIVLSEEPAPLEGIPGLSERITHLSKAVAAGRSAEIISAMKSILGAGPGLTPLGDDFLLGVLLAISRGRGGTGDSIYQYQPLVNAARKKTTRVSWSLLSCALLGSTDERLIRVLDGLISGREIPDQDLQELLAWGSSSGIAVLAGILIILSA